MRKRYVFREGRFIPWDEAPPLHPKFGQAPGLICDSMEPTEHPITGEVFESKSAFREVTKAHGCREVGNDLISKRKQERSDKPLTLEAKKDALEYAWAKHGGS